MSEVVVDARVSQKGRWQFGTGEWLVMAVTVLMLAVVYRRGLVYLWETWNSSAEYSHGMLIPLVSLFMLWQRRGELERLRPKGSWWGVGLLVVGLGLFLLGDLSTLYIIIHYSLLVVLFGIALSLLGWKGLRVVAVPIAFLVFMIPLPQFLYRDLSSALQLISSELGVAVIRAFGISVLLEGNVIDLGTYKLQVVEACSGLRYLFPLMSFGFLCAYIFKAPMWQRILVFLSTVPITVLMNSFRIGVIGVLVDNWGTAMAEGFLHDFEGWVIFMVCTALLLSEMWLLNRFLGSGRSFQSVFAVDLGGSDKEIEERRQRRALTRPYVAGLGAIALTLAAHEVLGERADVQLSRKSFDEFPMSLGDWRGARDTLEAVYLNALKLSDYIIANYQTDRRGWVNLYVAYYNSQRSGEAAHSPRSCIPGGGWRIEQLTRTPVEGARVAHRPLIVNRVEIQKGEMRQLVYYWFQQRGRVIANEYLVKWYLFWDALTRNRTDGALVRLTTVVGPDEQWREADERLADFAGALGPVLDAYVPE